MDVEASPAAGQAGASASLREALAGFAGGTVSGEELTETFQRETVFCQRSEQPGFLAVGPPGAGLVPVFTSLDELSRYAVTYGLHGGIDWLSTTGADVLDLLPDGYGIVVDPAAEHAVTLPAHALHRAVVFRRVEVGE
jgi:hypothetical protein